jgi:RimJ/RimL family protein N-acetyltransferase
MTRMSATQPVGDALDRVVPPPPEPRELRGGQVLLRPVDPAADAEPLYAESHPPASDAGLWTYMFAGPYPDAAALEADLRVMAVSRDPLYFTLVRLPEERPAGMAGYARIKPEHGVIEIGGIWFGASLRRSVAATEVIYLLAAHVFDELGYRRLEWKCDALNAASRRAAVRFGFTFEGIFRQHMVVKGRNRDTAWYAITDREWPEIRAAFQVWLSPENQAGGQQVRRLGDLMAELRR